MSAREGVRRLQELGFDPVHVVPAQQAGVPWGGSNARSSPAAAPGLYVFLR